MLAVLAGPVLPAGGLLSFTLTHPGGPGPKHRLTNLGRHLGSGVTQKNKRRPTIKRTFFQNTHITALASIAFSRMRTLATFFHFQHLEYIKRKLRFFFSSFVFTPYFPECCSGYLQRVAQVRDLFPDTDESIIL